MVILYLMSNWFEIFSKFNLHSKFKCSLNSFANINKTDCNSTITVVAVFSNIYLELKENKNLLALAMNEQQLN